MRLSYALGMRLAPVESLTTRSGRLNAVFERVRIGSVSLLRLRCGAEVDVHLAANVSTYLVVVRGAGRGVLVSDGVSVPLSPAVASPGRRVILRFEAESDVTVIRLRRSSVEDAARRGITRMPRPPLFAERLDPLDARVRAWLGAACRLWPPGGAREQAPLPMSGAHLEAMLARSLLDVQPLVRRDRPAVHEALEFCETRLDTEISVADIADAVGIGVRTLQYAFKEGLGSTPMGHLRALRLARVHAELLDIAGGRGHGGVTEAAGRWGFGHLGRFSALYRLVYGQLPSHTARFGAG